MALAMAVWSHMEAQGVQPTPEEHVDMIKGWAAAGELRQRVADGSVEAFLRQLGDMAFELGPSHEASSGEMSGAEGEESLWGAVVVFKLVSWGETRCPS